MGKNLPPTGLSDKRGSTRFSVSSLQYWFPFFFACFSRPFSVLNGPKNSYRNQERAKHRRSTMDDGRWTKKYINEYRQYLLFVICYLLFGIWCLLFVVGLLKPNTKWLFCHPLSIALQSINYIHRKLLQQFISNLRSTLCKHCSKQLNQWKAGIGGSVNYKIRKITANLLKNEESLNRGVKKITRANF